jgi:signal transduction histidine kinase
MGIAYEIVSGHGGSIDVASEKGKGTDVTVFLPREAAL